MQLIGKVTSLLAVRIATIGMLVFWIPAIIQTQVYTTVVFESAYAANNAGGDNGGTSSSKDAQTTPATTADAVDATLTTLVTLANLFTSLLTFLLTPLIMLAGWLLSPDWTFGDVFGLREIFHKIWILISNVVYVIFAIILVIIAFMNIFGWESAKSYEIKKALPKLIVSILIVPFTWFIVSATLSVTNVLTASVIQLPFDMLRATDGGQNILNKKMIPKTIIYNHGAEFNEGKADVDKTEDSKITMSAKGNFLASDCDAEDATNDCLSLEELLTKGNGGAYNLLSVYAYGIFKVQNYKLITDGQLKGGLKTLGSILNKLTFGLIFFIVFWILLIAIVYALFSRAVVLWIFAMFSPLFALNHFLEGKMWGKFGKKINDKFSIEKFISLAMVPVYVSAALAFGLMFLGTVMKEGGSGNGTLKWESGVEINNEWVDTTVMKFWDVTFTTIWLVTSESKQGLNGALDLGKGIIGTIIINVLALAILWMAVMAALEADEITGNAVKPIAEFGKSIGELAVKAPQYVPLKLPGMDKGISMSWVGNIWSGMHERIRSMANEGSTELGQNFGNKLGEALGLQIWEVTKAIGKIDAASKNAVYRNYDNDPVWKAKKVRDVITSAWVDEKIAIGNEVMRARIVKEIQSAYDLKDEDVAHLKKASNKEAFDQAFRELARRNTGKWMDYLADGQQGADSDKLSSIFAGTVSAVAEKIAGKTAWATQKITVKINNADQEIVLDKDTVLSQEATKTVLKWNDKDELKKIITGLNEAEAKKRLREVFDETKVNIDDLYNALK